MHPVLCASTEVDSVSHMEQSKKERSSSCMGTDGANHLVLLHQMRDAFPADSRAALRHLDVLPRAAVGLAAPLVRLPHQHPQVLAGVLRRWPAAPSVGPGARNSEQRADSRLSEIEIARDLAQPAFPRRAPGGPRFHWKLNRCV